MQEHCSLQNATKIPLLNLIATIVVERIFDVVIMLILLFLSIPFVLFKENIVKNIVIFTLIIIIGIIMVILLIYNVKFLETIWSFIFKKFSSFNQWGRDKITQVSNSLQIFKKWEKILTNYFLDDTNLDFCFAIYLDSLKRFFFQK